ncbi:hypothetical protein FisN_19Hh270 [Fistulifera solaris]|uniref:J domain-containing protein n=1 Tax=Fistulifera solaris TaxID=1519565 RepID=A0A1Z5K066_FISSO|nr:hypothetical protein FisN_19Hh270 [Fistulifera solaris]|eukprot:GAX19684.1 hypothetical protein FisN_19Hh270 [Fistulifera solaris]
MLPLSPREWTKRRSRPNHNSSIDPYQLLQIRRGATTQEIRHAYQRLALLHHPVRRRQQNQQMFEILAACYETLMDVEARRRCDLLLDEQETATLHRSLSWRSQKAKEAKVMGRMRHNNQQSLVGLNSMPSLAEVSSCASMDESLLTQDDDYAWRHVTTEAHEVDGQEQVEIVYSFESKGEKDRCVSPATTLRPLRILSSQQSSWDEEEEEEDSTTETLEDVQPPSSAHLTKDDDSSENDDTSEIHYTGAEIDRLFGGPLQLLFRARRWKVFRDPLEVFAEVFGNPLYGIKKNHRALSAPATSNTTLRSALPPPPLEKLPSEHVNRRTTIHRTRRVVGRQEIIRTAVVRIDPRTGQRHVTISVTRDDGMEEDEDPPPPQKDWFHFLDSLCVGGNGNNCFCFEFSICTGDENS